MQKNEIIITLFTYILISKLWEFVGEIINSNDLYLDRAKAWYRKVNKKSGLPFYCHIISYVVREVGSILHKVTIQDHEHALFCKNSKLVRIESYMECYQIHEYMLIYHVLLGGGGGVLYQTQPV